MSSAADPIVAIATAPGRGAIGVVRVSGPGIGALRDAVLHRSTPPREAVYGPFFDAAGDPIDHGLALFFPGPHSYTGEDVLELQAHGGPVVLQLLTQRLLALGSSLGLRLARPGEFTERAFLNGKMDLAQAEAVADLIDAQSVQAARLASRSLSGEFSKKIDTLLEKLTSLRMLVEATLDFPEEEVDVLAREDAAGKLKNVRSELTAVLAQAQMGMRLREGMTVVIAGEPNVGKSSLLNALAQEEVAIVTPVAGTTRDRIRETIMIEGMPVTVVDTAGLRQTDDAVEKIGVRRAQREIADADLVLIVQAFKDDSLPAEDDCSHLVVAAETMAREAGIPMLRVMNKVDLIRDRPSENGVSSNQDDKVIEIRTSALTGEGIDEIRKRLLTSFGWERVSEAQFMARERHLRALQSTGEHLENAVSGQALGLEILAEELRLAQQSLGEITGVMTADDLLGEIFSSFCIGK
ncbi:MAG: tRNA uridine-5-carboxymethylaminomethyl(34) synthesis GTPase MnmE [Burkholderiaceae bacterium]